MRVLAHGVPTAASVGDGAVSAASRPDADLGTDPTCDASLTGAGGSGQGPGSQQTAPDVVDAPVPVRAATGLELGEFIGKGAMGVVISARQHQIGREVAVKRVTAGPRQEKLSQSLRQEAIATGMLEHPNIVPVHDLVESPDGPWMVMKRVRGEPWSRLLSDAERCAEHLEDSDPLEFHVRVLMSVCRAVSCAHEEGVLHRDIKPDNIMVGRFGQVYLMDWGLAVALREIPGLPLAADLVGISGTPAFMAPEMGGGVGADLSVRTDVYLLGANLHFLLTGRGVHRGKNAQEAVTIVRRGAVPEYGPEVPAGLATIARQCLAKDPADRPESAEAVRRALASFLRHRAVERILAEAQQRADQVSELIATALGGEDDVAAIRAATAQARFGFELGLREWPEADCDGLHRLIEVSARYEIHRGNLEGAQALVAELPEPPEELVEALVALEVRVRMERGAASELVRIRLDADPRQRAVFRGILTMGLAVFCLLGGVGVNLIHWFARPIGVADGLPVVAGFSLISISGGLYYLSRPTNRAGREHAWMLILLALAIGAHWTGAWYTGLSVSTTIAWNGLLSAAMLGLASVVVDRGVIVSAPPYLLVMVAALLWPEGAFTVLGVGSFFSFAAYAILSVRRPKALAGIRL